MTHGRLLDRRRLEVLLDRAHPDGLLAALDGYRNADGGYGWGLEPDLRAPESQPVAAVHAFEVLAEVVPVTSPRSVELCDWLQSHTLPDGGLPSRFALPTPPADQLDICSVQGSSTATSPASLRHSKQTADGPSTSPRRHPRPLSTGAPRQR